MERDSGVTLEKTAVTAIARKAFSGLRAPKSGVKRVRLIGELVVTDGNGVLTLEGRISVNGLPFPVVTRVAATGRARDIDRVTQLVEDGLADVAAALKTHLSLVDAPPEDLMRALNASEPDVQVLSARLIGLRSLSKATPALCLLLGDPREPVAEAATEALIALRDPASVPCVIDSISKGNLRSEVRAIEILGHVGGREAIAYLEMTAGGHELEEVRTLSASLLKSLRERTAEAEK